MAEMAPANRHERRKRARQDRRAQATPLPVRPDRVEAFCDWIETLPPNTPFMTDPGFARFADLTDGEMMAAQLELGQRIADADLDVQNLLSLAVPVGVRRR